ncbi:ABC transporter substrate-binding protein [Jeotgalibaca sp. MA1X17-3]|uniref:ABC transporter substrate-binding protein n=1 Tax=Jeotgalibaca sp. MA1X17-3 TaxID=2908211 RepID=UPI001F3DB8E5|nr:ABC transporter substrate-binding protein [Jeotgalibaca sp. MA1X17-3]UJF15836.1 ABC transporter substrate-binding protein [Jeotgalibaca sp. MA1X17-3]
MKNWKTATLSLATVALLAACGSTNSNEGSDSSTANNDGNLVVSTFALSEDIIDRDIFQPFKKDKGIELVYEVGNSGERFTKLQNNPNSTIDVIELSQANAATGVEEGLFETLDETKVPNLANLVDGAMDAVATSGAPYTMNSIGIIYNEEAAGMEINEWSDLWDPSLAGKISIPDITTTFGPAMLHVASDFKGVDITTDDGAAAFEALNELKPNITKTYTKSSDLANLFQSGEIVAAVVGDFAYPIISGANPDVEYLVPESGTYANFNTLNVAVSSENKELAYEFINWKLSQELQTTTAASLNEAPTNKDVELDDEVAENKTYGDIAQRAKAIDYTFVNTNLEQWISQWNQTLNQ